MEVRISVIELGKALNVLHGVANKKTSMPILANVHLETINEDLVLSGTDLDIAVKLKKKAEIITAGSTTVSARSLLDIVKMLPGPDVVLKILENGHLGIKSGRTNARLMTLDPNEFPSLPFGEQLSFQKVHSQTFLTMVQKTIFSSSFDESRHNLTGVYFEPQKDDEKSLCMVATDGHRLSKVKETFPEGNFQALGNAILPRKGLSELLKLVDQEKDSIESFELGISQNHAIIKTEESYLSMRLIDGVFPDYTQVIPRLADKMLRASRHDFLLSVKRVSVLASEKNQSIRLKTLKGDLTIACVNPETGEMSDDVPVEYNGPDIEIGFNARYVIEALSSISDNNIMIKFTDPLSPTIITGLRDDKHQCVIMPMRM